MQGAHLAGLGAGQTARQGSAVGRQGGGERGAAVCQHGFKVAARLSRLREFSEVSVLHPSGRTT